MFTIPKAFRKEFREDVIRVFRDAAEAEAAKDFGISPSCLKRWLTVEDKTSAVPRQRRDGIVQPAADERPLQQPWATRGLRIEIVTWRERTYHRRRRRDALGRLTPVEYELIMTTAAAQAA